METQIKYNRTAPKQSDRQILAFRITKWNGVRKNQDLRIILNALSVERELNLLEEAELWRMLVFFLNEHRKSSLRDEHLETAQMCLDAVEHPEYFKHVPIVFCQDAKCLNKLRAKMRKSLGNN